MSKPKLTYFDFPGGRGEECRLALHVAGIDFEDNRVKGETWRALKASTPYGSLPTLELGGKGVLAQSNAILRFVGSQHEMHPTDAWEAARHEALMEACEDLRHEVELSAKISDEEEKARARREYVGRWLDDVEAQIRGPFVGGASINVADLKLFNLLRWFKRGGVDHVAPTVFDERPRVSGLFAAVGEHPRVVDWYARG